MTLYSCKHIKAGVYAYISSSAATTITAGNWARLAGTFTNEILEYFYIDVDTITYNGPDRYFEIQLHGSFQSDTNNTLITLGLYKNGSLEANSQMETLCKTSNENYAMGLVDVFHMTKGDTIEIYIKADKSCDVTATKLNTSAQLYY